MLRLGDQIVGGRAARVVHGTGVQAAIGHVVLEDFVHQIDVRHGRVGVLAAQGEGGQVWTAPGHRRVLLSHEGIQRRVARRIGARLPQELEQIDQVGCRAHDGPAVLARAEVH